MVATVDKTKEHIQLIRELSNELAAFFYSLPEDIWRNAEQYASACQEWKIADVVTHLIACAHQYHLSLSRALKGDVSPPMGYRRLVGRADTDALVALRQAYFEDLFPEFNASCRLLNSLLVSLRPEDYERPTWHPLGVVPARRIVEYRLMELAVHGWDIQYGLDRSAALPPKALPFLVEWLGHWLRLCFRAGARLEAPVRYRFQLEGPVAEGYDVVISGDDFRLTPSEDAPAHVTFRCDAGAYILFGMGRLPFARSVRRGRLAFQGDEKLASSFADWFPPV